MGVATLGPEDGRSLTIRESRLLKKRIENNLLMQVIATFLKPQTCCQEDTSCHKILTFLQSVETPTYGSVTKAMRKPAAALCTVHGSKETI